MAQTTLKKVKYNYLLNVPEDYDKYPDKKWPVIFYLHGRHASGKNLQSVKRYGLPYFLSKGKKLDFIVISPNVHGAEIGPRKTGLIQFTMKLQQNCGSTIHVFTWLASVWGDLGPGPWPTACPTVLQLFHHFVVGADVKWADQLSKVPTWVFHGTADRDIPISRSEVMVKALEKRNAEIKFTRLKNQGHDISKQFNNDNLYSWLLEHSLKKNAFLARAAAVHQNNCGKSFGKSSIEASRHCFCRMITFREIQTRE